jgi:hypothetical protein
MTSSRERGRERRRPPVMRRLLERVRELQEIRFGEGTSQLSAYPIGDFMGAEYTARERSRRIRMQTPRPEII